jgi:hypothetical protein
VIATFNVPLPAVVHGRGQAQRPGFESVVVLAVYTQPDDGMVDAFTSLLVIPAAGGHARWAAREDVEFEQV